MAIKTRRLSKNVAIKLGTKVIGCAKTFKTGFKVNKLDSACAGSNGIDTAEPGNVSFTFEIGGIERVYTEGDIATNVAITEMWAKALAGEEVTIIETGPAAGDPIETYVGYFESGDKNVDIANLSQYNLSGWANSRVAGTVPA